MYIYRCSITEYKDTIAQYEDTIKRLTESNNLAQARWFDLYEEEKARRVKAEEERDRANEYAISLMVEHDKKMKVLRDNYERRIDCLIKLSEHMKKEEHKE